MLVPHSSFIEVTTLMCLINILFCKIDITVYVYVFNLQNVAVLYTSLYVLIFFSNQHAMDIYQCCLLYR